MVGDRFADKVLDAGVDRKNEFMWVTVATETCQMGIANIYLWSPLASKEG